MGEKEEEEEEEEAYHQRIKLKIHPGLMRLKGEEDSIN